MSSTQPEQEDPELKAGHAPAVKAGGMRIVQHKHGNEPKPEQPTKEDEEEFGTSPPKADTHHSSVLVSGAQTKGDKDFTPEAIKQFHEKPLPKNDCRPVNKPHNIHQPGKH